MSTNNNKQAEEAKQLKQKQTSFLDDVERFKENADAETLKRLEEIESHGWSIVIELDEIAKRQNQRLAGEYERNTILSRMRGARPKPRPTLIGNVRV